jgi:hypothetical protein
LGAARYRTATRITISRIMITVVVEITNVASRCGGTLVRFGREGVDRGAHTADIDPHTLGHILHE